MLKQRFLYFLSYAPNFSIFPLWLKPLKSSNEVRKLLGIYGDYYHIFLAKQVCSFTKNQQHRK